MKDIMKYLNEEMIAATRNRIKCSQCRDTIAYFIVDLEYGPVSEFTDSFVCPTCYKEIAEDINE
jgi:hypothetical protein